MLNGICDILKKKLEGKWNKLTPVWSLDIMSLHTVGELQEIVSLQDFV